MYLSLIKLLNVTIPIYVTFCSFFICHLPHHIHCQGLPRDRMLISEFLYCTPERRGTPVLLSASVSNNSVNSPQMTAARSSCEIDQSTQRFHVGCGYVNHGILLILDDSLNCKLLNVGEMILILTYQAVFVTLSVVTIPSLVQPSLF